MRKLKSILACILFCTLAQVNAQDAKKQKMLENNLIEAVSALGKNDVENAFKKLQALDKTYPGNDAVLYYLGKCYILMHKPEEAGKCLQQAVAADSTNLFYQHELASLYTETGMDGPASAIYLSLVKKDPKKYTNPYTLCLLGNEHLYKGEDSLAMESFDKALAYEPDYIPALLGKADAYRLQYNIPAFFATVSTVLGNDSFSSYGRTRYVNDILEHINGNFFMAYGAQLDSMVNTCVRKAPTDSSALKLAGRWYYGTDRKEKGREYFGRLLDNYPEDLNAHYIHLQMLFDGGSSMKAVIDECENIIRIGGEKNPEVLPAMVTIGDCYHTLGQDKNAYKAYERVLKLDPEYLPVLNNYAYYLSLEGKKLKKAEQMSRITVEKDPDNATYLDTYGWILYLRGEPQRAKPYFKHAMLYGGRDNPVILEHYAKVLRALGETELAKSFEMLSESKKKEDK